MNKEIRIGSRTIGKNAPAFIVAEMSANHNMDYNRAVQIVRAAKEAGADAVKIQTYTADTITLESDRSCFQITQGTLWDGITLHKLYETAYTPWEWQPKLNNENEKYLTEIAIYAHNRSGLLADISKTLMEKNIDVISMNTRVSKQGIATLAMSFEIGGRDELRAIIEKLKQIDNIIDIERTTG